MRKILILGGGGHAKGLLETLRICYPESDLAIIDPGLEEGTQVAGVPVIGGDDRIATLRACGFETFVVGLGGIGDNGPRARLFETGQSAGLKPLTLIHPSATISPSAQLAAGAQCLWGAIIAAGAIIGSNTIVNSGAVVEHDCRIGDHVHIATAAALAGQVTVDALAHIGANATIIQQLHIGSRAIVGAGAVVTKSVPPDVTVVGAPARILRGGKE